MSTRLVTRGATAGRTARPPEGQLPAVRWFALWLPALLAFPTFAQTPAMPAGHEFQVNTTSDGKQFSPSVSTSATGAFVVVWASAYSGGTDHDEGSIQGQRFASDGSTLGGEFQINTLVTSHQDYPSVSMGADGGFVVVWTSSFSSGTDSVVSIQGQRYAPDGSALGGQFQVNTYTSGFQTRSSVSVGPAGEFVVVWMSDGSSGTDDWRFSIQGQRYASDGSALGGEFQINTYTRNDQGFPSVSMTPDGGFVVVWMSDGSNSDTSASSVKGRLYTSSGSASTEFQINTYTTGDQIRPQVSTTPAGGFVVVWTSGGSSGTDTLDNSIQGQIFDHDGLPYGGEFQVNTYTAGNQRQPQVSVDRDGVFVVVWASDGSSGTDQADLSVQGQLYASGSVLGSQFQINTYTTDNQWLPSVSASEDGDFVVVWASDAGPASSDYYRSILGQRFRDVARIFEDGFEAGNTSAWSSTTPP